jgi:hypothetical protein
MTHRRKGIFAAIFAALILTAVFATSAARACAEDSEGLALIDGELPGGG